MKWFFFCWIFPDLMPGGSKLMRLNIYARTSDSLCTIFALSSFLPLNGIIILCIVPFFCPIMHKKSKTAMFYGLLNAQAPLFRLPGPQNRSFFRPFYWYNLLSIQPSLNLKKGNKNIKKFFHLQSGWWAAWAANVEFFALKPVLLIYISLFSSLAI